ncbi:phage tail assembly chaperone [bacterium]|nr:phage tail assembly chaperone [bacterium]
MNNIIITEVRNAVSLQSDNLRMDVEINHPVYGWIPYTIDPVDTDTTINNNDVLSLIGTEFVQYVAPTQEELDAEAAAQVRLERDNILVTEVDPFVTNPLRWDDLTSEERDAWTTFRRDLLNVPDQSGFPHNITWPTKPE